MHTVHAAAMHLEVPLVNSGQVQPSQQQQAAAVQVAHAAWHGAAVPEREAARMWHGEGGSAGMV